MGLVKDIFKIIDDSSITREGIKQEIRNLILSKTCIIEASKHIDREIMSVDMTQTIADSLRRQVADEVAKNKTVLYEETTVHGFKLTASLRFIEG